MPNEVFYLVFFFAFTAGIIVGAIFASVVFIIGNKENAR